MQCRAAWRHLLSMVQLKGVSGPKPSGLGFLPPENLNYGKNELAYPDFGVGHLCTRGWPHHNFFLKREERIVPIVSTRIRKFIFCVESTLHSTIFWEMVKFVDLGVLYFSLVLPV